MCSRQLKGTFIVLLNGIQGRLKPLQRMTLLAVRCCPIHAELPFVIIGMTIRAVGEFQFSGQ